MRLVDGFHFSRMKNNVNKRDVFTYYLLSCGGSLALLLTVRIQLTKKIVCIMFRMYSNAKRIKIF